MTVYVIRDGQLVERNPRENARVTGPYISRFESFESPVTGESISSWRQRERDMNAADAIDRRDIPQSVFEKRQRISERNARHTQS